APAGGDTRYMGHFALMCALGCIKGATKRFAPEGPDHVLVADSDRRWRGPSPIRAFHTLCVWLLSTQPQSGWRARVRESAVPGRQQNSVYQRIPASRSLAPAAAP